MVSEEEEEYLTLDEALQQPGLYSVRKKASGYISAVELFLVIAANRGGSAVAARSCTAVFIWRVDNKWTLHPYFQGSAIDTNKCEYKLQKTQHLEFSITLKTNEE